MQRSIRRAEVLAVGSELTTGTTRDSNAGDLARELTGLGVTVERMTALPDNLAAVTQAFINALAEVDLVMSTGGLGPTPDDLTREAIAAACGLQPTVDREIETWLRDLFERRGIMMADANLKQAWLIDGASPLANEYGTAPGWWVDRPDGRLIVALPGPPREMWPMWRAQVLPRLGRRAVGLDRASHVLRLTGIGESQLVPLIGEELLRAGNPQVATYARADAVDVAISAIVPPGGSPSAAELVRETVADVRRRVGRFIFAEGEDGWPEALARVLSGRMLATVEMGTHGQLLALLGSAPFLRFGELLAGEAAMKHSDADLGEYAQRVCEVSGADIGLAVRAEERAGDIRVLVAISTRDGTQVTERTAFLAGDEGRRRAALAACVELWQALNEGS